MKGLNSNPLQLSTRWVALSEGGLHLFTRRYRIGSISNNRLFLFEDSATLQLANWEGV